MFLRIVFLSLLAFVSLGINSPSALEKTKDSEPPKNFQTAFYPKKNKKEVIVKHTAFALCYSEIHEQAKWVAYRLTSEMFKNNEEERTDNFREDPLVKTGSATLDDYKGSGYDRGHLCPAGDMAWSNITMSESFLMSNMSPQEPKFNRGIWKKLETKVRDWAQTNEELYVVTAGVLEQELKTIGENKVSVPHYYYKVVLDVKLPEYKAIAFILPNEGSKNDIFDYAVSIDSVESLTGINFFYSLPDKLENNLEAHIDVNKWH